MIRKLFILFVAMLLSTASYANWFQDIINAINKQGGITNGILNRELSIQQDILTSQESIDSLMQQVNGHMTGNSGWGTYQAHDYQSYGESARDWSSVMHMAENGSGSGALGQEIGGVANQFPINKNVFNHGTPDATSQNYYAIKAQTILAARAASQLDYNKIQDQITYQQMLQQQIEKTKDLKAAIDLSNRIQVEGNLITLEILRQSALANQQQAITEQATLNSALANARFLTKE
jgi:Type IV secretion system proteins